MEAFVAIQSKDDFRPVYRAIERACKRCSEKHAPDGTAAEERLPVLHGLTASRLDDSHRPGDVGGQLIEAIQDSALFIADLTGNNANVAWELGFANATP